jgi:hypothetical protein
MALSTCPSPCRDRYRAPAQTRQRVLRSMANVRFGSKAVIHPVDVYRAGAGYMDYNIRMVRPPIS